jgi:hypothetical protein
VRLYYYGFETDNVEALVNALNTLEAVAVTKVVATVQEARDAVIAHFLMNASKAKH